MSSEAMNPTEFADRLRARFPDGVVSVVQPRGEVTLDVEPADWFATATALRDESGFDTLVDVSGVDYLGYGADEWDTDVSSEGFSRGVEGKGPGRFVWGESPNGAADAPERRFAAVAHLLSVQNNLRVRLRTFAADDALPVVDSLTSVWPGANWFEREAFDLYGIIFEGHPDLRRILMPEDYEGYPQRRDFPIGGEPVLFTIDEAEGTAYTQ